MKNSVIDAEIRVKVVSDGLDKFANDIKKLQNTNKAVESLLKLSGSISASNTIIGELRKTGNLDALSKYVNTIENISKRISNIKVSAPPALSFPIPEVPLGSGTRDKVKEAIFERRLARQKGKYSNLPGLASYSANIGIEKITDRVMERRSIANKNYKKDVQEYNQDIITLLQELYDVKLLLADTNKKVKREIAETKKRLDSIKESEREKIVDSIIKGKEDRKSIYTEHDEKNLEKLRNEQYAEQALRIEREAKKELSDANKRAIYETRFKSLEPKIKGDDFLKNAVQSGNVKGIQAEIAERGKLIKQYELEAEAKKKLLLSNTNKEQLESLKEQYEVALLNVATAKEYIKTAQEALVTSKEKKQLDRDEYEAYRQTAAADKKASDERRKQNAKTIEQLIKEKQVRADIASAEKKARELVASVSAGNKISRKDLDFKLREINAELAKIPANQRAIKAIGLSEEFKKIGIHTKQINGHLELVKINSKHIESHISKSVKDMFSIEKLVARISFVITAKMSYVAFDKVIQGIKAAIGLNVQFRDEMSKTFALIGKGVNETEEQFAIKKKRIEEDVASLAKTYRISLKDASEGVYQIVSAQIPLENLTTVLDASMRLAVGGFSNLNDASLALVQLLNAYDLGAEKAMHLADVVFQTTKLGILTTQQYTDQMSKVASTASIFGISIEEVSAAISTMTRNGIKVDQAFTSLNQLLMTIANPTKESEKLMEKYGVSMSIADVRAKGLVGTLTDLYPLLSNEESATTLFKSRTGFKAMASLSQNTEDYINDLVAMYDSVDISANAANERLETTASIMNRLKSESAELGRQIGASLEPVVKKVFVAMSNAIQFLTKNMFILRTVVKAIAIHFAVAFSSALIKNIARLRDTIPKLIIGFKSLATSVLGLQKAQQAVAAGAATTATAVKAGFAAMSGGILAVVEIVMQLINLFVELGKKAHETYVKKVFDVGNTSQKIEQIDKTIGSLDAKLSSIEGLNKMAKQADALYNSMGNNVAKAKEFEMIHNKTAEAISKVLGVQINATNMRGRLATLENQMQLRYIELEQQKIQFILQRSSVEQQAFASQMTLDATKNRPGDIFSRVNIPGVIKGAAVDANTAYSRWVTGLMTAGRIVAVNDISTASEQQLSEWENLLNSEISLVKEGIKKYQNYNEVITGGNSILAGLMGYLQLINQARLAEIDGMKLKAYEHVDVTSDAGGGSTKNITNKIREFVDAYINLYREAGFAIETKYENKITDLRNKLNDILQDIKTNDKDNIIVPSPGLINSLEWVATSLSEFVDFENALKQKAHDAESAISAVKNARNELLKLNLSKDSKWITEVQNNLRIAATESGVDELNKLADEWPSLFENIVINTNDALLEFTEKMYEQVIKAGRTKAERDSRLKAILSEEYEDFYNKVLTSTYNELERMLKDDDISAISKMAIDNAMEQRRKSFAKIIRDFYGEYGTYLPDLEDSMKDMKSVYSYLSDILEKFGVDMDGFADLLSAMMSGDTAAMSGLYSKIRGKQTAKAEDAYGEITKAPKIQIKKSKKRIDELNEEKNKLDLLYQKNKILYDDYISEHKKIDFEINTLKGIVDESQSTIDTIDNLIKDAEGIENVPQYIEVKLSELESQRQRLEQQRVQITADIKTESGVDVNSLDIDKNSIIQRIKEIDRGLERNPQSLPTNVNIPKSGILRQEYAILQNKESKTEEENKRLEYLTSIIEFADNLLEERRLLSEKLDIYKSITSQGGEPNIDIPALIEQLNEVNKSIAEITDSAEQLSAYSNLLKNYNWTSIKLTEQDFKNILNLADIALPGGWDKWEPKSKREYIREVYGLKPGQEKVSQTTAANVGDYLKDKYIGGAMTVDDLWTTVEGKSIEVINQAWDTYWDNRINAAEEAKEKLLEIENEKMKAMLANENLSSEQQARLQERFAEKRHLIEEREQKKISELNKKRAKADLAIGFAKSVALIWAKEISEKSAIGLASAAALTAFLAAMFALQLNMINKQSFAEGGYTGKGYGKRDSSGYRPAGVVHEGELVIDKKTVDKNYSSLLNMYSALKGGQDFNTFAVNHLLGQSGKSRTIDNNTGMFASGGFVKKPVVPGTEEPINVFVNMGNIRTLDPVDLNILVEQGARRRRVIRG